jgi:hypothetical protein
VLKRVNTFPQRLSGDFLTAITPMAWLIRQVAKTDAI